MLLCLITQKLSSIRLTLPTLKLLPNGVIKAFTALRYRTSYENFVFCNLRPKTTAILKTVNL